MRTPRKSILPLLLSVGLVLTGCAGYMMETEKSAEMMQDTPSMIVKGENLPPHRLHLFDSSEHQ